MRLRGHSKCKFVSNVNCLIAFDKKDILSLLISPMSTRVKEIIFVNFSIPLDKKNIEDPEILRSLKPNFK